MSDLTVGRIEQLTTTPGPWVMRPGVCRNDHPDTSADVHGAHGEFVADCGCHDHAAANARLIAASHDLLDLLAACKAYFASDDNSEAEVQALLDMHRAVAKAEGRDL